MTIQTTLATGLHSGDAEFTDLQKAVKSILDSLQGRSTFAHGRAAAQSAGKTYSTAFLDIPESAITVTTNGIDKARYHIDFSAFAQVGAGQWQIQLLVDGVQTGEIFVSFWNALGQHQGWSFQWEPTPAAGSHTFKCQMKSAAVVNGIVQDAGDYIIATLDEGP